MLQFLIPAALLAAAGVIVPVLIHLWRPPARTIRLGSLRFLTAVPGRRMRDLRWRDRLLLLVRVALILTLAALLAQPLWIHLAQGPQRWALRAHNAKFDASTQVRWNALLAQGYQPRWFAPGFPDAANEATAPTPASIDAWSLLREADARVPKGSKLVVFAPPQLAMLRGGRPALNQSEATIVPAFADETPSPSIWLHSLSLTGDGGGARASIGSSSETATRFSQLRIPAPLASMTATDPATKAELELRKANDAVTGRLAAPKPAAWLPARTWRPVRVAIVHGPARAGDARYAAAAIRAAGEVADRAITLEVREETNSTVLPEADWVFRIGVAPLSASLSRVLAENNVNVVSDAPLNAVEDPSPSWFVAPDKSTDMDTIRLWNRVSVPPENRAVIWSDGFGNPLLTFSREGRAERWQFLSRFHPDWNDWVRSGAFPEWIRALVLREADGITDPPNDRRLTNASQFLPATSAPGFEAVALSQPSDRTTNLQLWIWALVALLLALERWMSLRSGTSQSTSDARLPVQKSDPETAEVVR